MTIREFNKHAQNVCEWSTRGLLSKMFQVLKFLKCPGILSS